MRFFCHDSLRRPCRSLRPIACAVDKIFVSEKPLFLENSLRLIIPRFAEPRPSFRAFITMLSSDRESFFAMAPRSSDPQLNWR
jgi:hypothetical protein